MALQLQAKNVQLACSMLLAKFPAHARVLAVYGSIEACVNMEGSVTPLQPHADGGVARAL